MFVAAGTAEADWDPLSFGRSAIEPHSQDRHPSDLDFVIDAARDLLEFLFANAPSVADAWITIWRESAAPVLKRLAIHGLANRAVGRPKETLSEVLSAGWLHRSALKHETFHLLARAYSPADESTRLGFLDEALAKSVLRSPPSTPEEANTEAYERYNLLVWLARVAPESAVTAERLAEFKTANPAFQPREHPDLTHWSSGVHAVVPVSPRPVEDLLSKSPADQLDWLLTYQGERSLGEGPDREGLLIAVRDACKASFDWSWSLAEGLRDRGDLEDASLWGAVLDAWQDSVLEESQWTRVLGLLEVHRHLERKAAYEVSRLLEHAAKEDSRAPVAMLIIVRDVAERLAMREDLEDSVSSAQPDWLLRAINHPAGRGALAWLQTLEKLRSAAGEVWKGMPAEEQERLERVIGSRTLGADRARTIFASQVHFLYALDPVWTDSKLLPLFDWMVDADRAAHAWDGYLEWGRWNDELLERMRPYLEQTFGRVDPALNHRRDDLAARLAGVTLYSSADPWHGGSLERFIVAADSETLVAWAAALGRQLRELSPEAATLAWTRWMRDYWRERLTGVPRPFSDGEREAMLDWVFGLRPVLGEVVELLEVAPVSLPEHGMVLYELRENGLAKTDPQLIARLLRHVLAGTTQLQWECSDISTIVDELIEANADRAVLLDICESMARLRCSDAASLRSRLG
jgi:uncharacterized protein DUF4020